MFLARSVDPPAILSITADEGDVVEHEAENGETTTRTSIGGHDALLVTNAVLAELPAGIAANELLVANGSQSFSLILSASEPRLRMLWNDLVATVVIN